MTITESLGTWATAVAHEIEEIAITKHSTHLAKLRELTAELKEYVAIFDSKYRPIIAEHIKTLGDLGNEKQTKRLSYLDMKNMAHRQAMKSEIGNSISYDASPAPLSRGASRSILLQKRLSSNNLVYRKTVRTDCVRVLDMDHIVNPTRTDAKDIFIETKGLCSTDPSKESEFNFLKATEEQKFKAIEHFAAHGTMRRIVELTKGVERLDLQGSIEWTENIEELEGNLAMVQNRYDLCLDEKRNFWGFTLGIVSIATFPFAVMTGYFGKSCVHNVIYVLVIYLILLQL